MIFFKYKKTTKHIIYSKNIVSFLSFEICQIELLINKINDTIIINWLLKIKKINHYNLLFTLINHLKTAEQNEICKMSYQNIFVY